LNPSQARGPLRRLTEDSPRPDPVIHPETEPFWSGLAQGELKLQECGACHTYRFPFAPVCFKCLSFESTWRPISPRGTVAIAVRVHRATGNKVWAAHAPFISGLVDMEHGVRLPGRIHCTCGEATKRATSVSAVVIDSPGGVPILGFMHACVARKE
jgi:uncharacterized OB-fold protein